jgi:Lon protease-like protein
VSDSLVGVPLFPLSVVLFPGMVLPLHIFEERYKTMIQNCLQGNQQFGVVFAQPTPEGETVTAAHGVGTLALITRVDRLDDGHMNIETVGLERFRLLRLVRLKPYAVGDLEVDPLQEDSSQQVAEALKDVGSLFVDYLRQMGEVIGTHIQVENVPRDPPSFVYLVAMALQVPLEEKQELLAAPSLSRMASRERLLLQREGKLLERMRLAQESNVGYVRGATDFVSLN